MPSSTTLRKLRDEYEQMRGSEVDPTRCSAEALSNRSKPWLLISKLPRRRPSAAEKHISVYGVAMLFWLRESPSALEEAPRRLALSSTVTPS